MKNESEFSQLLLYQKMYDDYCAQLTLKYWNYKFKVIREPIATTYFKLHECYDIDGFSCNGGKVYIRNLEQGMTRVICIDFVEILDTPGES